MCYTNRKGKSDMHEVKLLSYQVPKVNEVGYLEDVKGEWEHPNRLLSDLHVFIFVESGKIEVVEDQTTYTLTSGDYLFLHKGIVHGGTKRYQPSTSWYYIHFFASHPNDIPEYHWGRSPSIIPEETYCKRITLPKTGRVEQVDYLIMKLQQIIADQRNGPLAQSLSCYQLFLDLYRQAKKTQQKPQTEKIVNKIINLCQNSDQKLSSEKIAQQLHLNYSYISTIFKKETGKTINRYQNEQMIERAITLFNQTDANISEVSEQLQFPNPFYFSRVFKQITGISPSDYLKQRYKQ